MRPISPDGSTPAYLRPKPRLWRTGSIIVFLGLLVLPWSGWGASKPIVRVGSKSFTESYILGEIIAYIIEHTGEARVERKFGLGGTGITYRALESGAIDIYPEYTGTLSHVILKEPTLQTPAAIRQRLHPQTLTISDPLGFNNTYALAIRRHMATQLRLHTISDLSRYPQLRGGFSSGFLERDDGWPGLRRHYGLRLADVRTLEHTLTYEALAHGDIDVMDVFSTDGKLTKFDLVILQDDRQFFPTYYAVLFVRQAFLHQFPRTWDTLQRLLVHHIDDALMARLNALAELEGKSFQQIRVQFLQPQAASESEPLPFLADLYTFTLDHLYLVAVSLGVAMLLGIPLGIVAARCHRLGQIELMSIGVLQTIPALALLCFMIPLFGIGKLPALVALCLYALLPIVRNTYTGMISLDRQLLEIAGILGLNAWQRLWRIELPLASLSITAGIKTSAVYTVGTATLAALIGGGGYGTFIVRGLALDDLSTILAGALPAALMAVGIHGVCEFLDRLVIPKGLRKNLSRPLL